MAISDEVYVKIIADSAQAMKNMVSLGSTIAGLKMAFETVKRVVVDLTQAYFEQEQAEAKLSAVLKSTGGAAGYTTTQLAAMATELQSVTTFGDETIISAQAVLATFTKVGRDVFPRAIEAALDMSTVMGQDLQSSIVQIGKALNDPIAGVTALRRVGVQLTEQQKESIESFMAQGNVMAAQQVILKELQTEFGGAAVAMGETSYGATVKLTNAIGELKEALGGMIANGAGPLLTTITGAVQELTSWINWKRAPEGLEKTTLELQMSRAELAKMNEEHARNEAIFERTLQKTRAQIALEADIEKLVRLQAQQAFTASAAERERMMVIENRARLEKEAETRAAAVAAAAERRLADLKNMDLYAGHFAYSMEQMTGTLPETGNYFTSIGDNAALIHKRLERAADALEKVEDRSGSLLKVTESEAIYAQVIAQHWGSMPGNIRSVAAASTAVVQPYEKIAALGVSFVQTMIQGLRGNALDAVVEFAATVAEQFGPVGKAVGAVMRLAKAVADIFADPTGKAQEFVDAIAAGIDSGDWSSVEEALNAQIRDVFVSAAVQEAALEQYGRKLSRAIAKYLRKGDDASLQGVQDAYADLLAAGSEAAAILAQLQGATGLGDIPKMAAGGIVTRPTLALIGENGPEEVRPLGAGGGGGVHYHYHIAGSMITERDVDRRVAAANTRKGRGW